MALAWTIALLTSVVALLTPATIMASRREDPYPLRNQFPLHLIFLDQTPRSARLLDRGERRLTLHTTYENTQVGTDALIDAFLIDDFQTFNGIVTQPILEAVAAANPEGTAFYVDGETMRTVIDFAGGLSERFEFDVEIPFLMHTGGFLDSIIDNYHEALDLPDGGRPGFQHDRYAAGYVTPGTTVFVEGGRNGIRLGDIVLTGRTALVKAGEGHPAITLSMSAKLPTGDADRLDGSGSADYGTALEISGRAGRSNLHAGYAYMKIGAWDLAPDLNPRNSRSLFGTWVFAATPRTALIAQLLRTWGPFGQTAGNDLGRATTEIAFGMRHGAGGGLLFDWALIENLDNDFSAPDIGAFLGLTVPVGRNGGAASVPKTP